MTQQANQSVFTETLTTIIWVSRPILWFALPAIFFFSLLQMQGTFTPLAIIQLVLLSFPYCLFVYGINDIYDQKSDAINKRKHKILGIKLQSKHHTLIRRSALIVFLVFLLTSLLTQNRNNVLATLLLFFISYYYSARPIRMKTIPILDSVSNGMLFLSVVFLAHSFAAVPIDIKYFWLSLVIMAGHSFATIPDYSVDKKSGDTTIAVFFGKRFAALFSLALTLFIFLFSGIEHKLIRIPMVITGAIFFIGALWPKEKFVLRLALLLCSLVVVCLVAMLLLW